MLSRAFRVAGLATFLTLATLALLQFSPIKRNLEAPGESKVSANRNWRLPTASPRPIAPSNRTCRLKLSLPREVFSQADAITLDLQFFNDSPDPVTIWLSGFWTNHQIVVHDEDGTEAPLTERGQQLRDAFSPGGGRDKNSPRVIPPGGSHDHSGQELSELHRLSPGKYRVEVTYHDEQAPTPMIVTSNSVDFEIR